MILDNVSESICLEFELNSYGTVRQLFPEMMGGYFLQSVRNNGRNVYRTKNVVSNNYQQYPTIPHFIYLYSFNAEDSVCFVVDRVVITVADVEVIVVVVVVSPVSVSDINKW